VGTEVDFDWADIGKLMALVKFDGEIMAAAGKFSILISV
jgi:hypothetical protein